MILAGDVGATKILLEVGDLRSGRWQPALARRYLMDDFPGIDAVLAAFLQEWEAMKPPRARITAGALGAAGPAQGNKIRMTHRPWPIDGDAIARRFKIRNFRVVNDLAAAANGIDLLGPRDFLTIQPGKAVEGEPRVVLGVGTGLGVAYLMNGVRPQTKDWGLTPIVIPGEGGHVGFSPASATQHEVWRNLFATHGRVEAEDVASGRGIAKIHHALTGHQAETGDICNNATTGDSQCAATLEVFAECLGNVAGDHALAVMARGGIFLAGGVTARIAPSIKSERFRAAFCAKGLMASLLMKIPVRAITNDRLAVLGAARVAMQTL